MIKSTKRFPINTEVTNGNGFRVRTTGVELSHFKLNPLLLWMHQRPKGLSKDEILPLGYWEDIELKDGKVTGVPVFDDEDEFAMRIYKKVENGSIKAASAGLKPLQFTETGGEKWLERSILKEASICDMGSNHESVGVVLYNDQDEIITLAEFKNTEFQTSESKSKNDMKKIELSEPTIGLLKLAEGDDATKAHAAVQELITLTETQKGELITLKEQKEAAEIKLAETEVASKTATIVALVDKAVEDRKITADQKETMVKLAQGDFDSTKSYLDGLKANPTVASQIKTGGNEHMADALMKLSYDELDKSGKLEKLKEDNIEGFKLKFKEKWNKEY